MDDRLIELRAVLSGYFNRGRKVDMTRGNPSPEQVALALPMLENTETSIGGFDCANYGPPPFIFGLPEAKQLFGKYLGVSSAEVIVQGNSSLALMHDIIAHSCISGAGWGRWENVKFICPTPGYDRHFAMCEEFGIHMIPVPLGDDGPDMDAVEEYARDPSVVGMWCVPKYSNPTGITYAPDVVRRIASMPVGNPGFRVFWDCAYQEHHLSDEPDILENFAEACKSAHNLNRYLIFGSFSKVTIAGAAIAAVAMNDHNREWYLRWLRTRSIGPDKLNQLRHVRFLKDLAGIRAHMAKHRAIMAPRFDAVDEVFQAHFKGRNDVRWSKPRGGYFISVTVPRGCAGRAISLAGQVGVRFTKEGSAFPGGRDPNGDHFRIAPTMGSVDDARYAAKVAAVSIDIAALERSEK